jgi:hypothetical protein
LKHGQITKLFFIQCFSQRFFQFSPERNEEFHDDIDNIPQEALFSYSIHEHGKIFLDSLLLG